MKKQMAIILIMLIILLSCGCSSSETSEEVKELEQEAIDSSDYFLLTPIKEPSFVDEDGYWMFGIDMNNLSNYDIYVDMSSDLKIFYKDGADWFETTNRSVNYSNEWYLPASNDLSTRVFMINPFLKRENVTFRVFVVGYLADENGTKIIGMVEYVIEMNNLIEINVIDQN
jgi:hypothetical protein